MGIYVCNSLKVIERPDIKFSMDLVESCWVEIEPGYQEKNITGCIYRHPKASIEIFTHQLNELLKHLNQNKYQFYILRDINIDFLQYLNHQPTEKYLDMLHINYTAPLITKPTRITNHTKTLIDHIYTNMFTSQITSGIALHDISDHLPIFCIINTPIKRKKEKRFYIRF